MAELNPPLGTTTPEIFMDNVKRADELVNGPAGTVNDRGGEPLDTWRQMMAKNDEIRQNIIPLSKQYATLAAAQADIANIPEGSTTYYRSPDESALAIEVMNVGGTLQPTGRKMISQAIFDALFSYVNSVMPQSFSASVLGWTIAFMNAEQTGLFGGFDESGGFRLAEMPDAVQDRLRQLGDYDLLTSIPGFHALMLDSDSKAGFAVTQDWSLLLAGLDRSVQDEIADLKTGTGSAILRPYNGVLAVFKDGSSTVPVYSVQPVAYAQKLTAGGASIVYEESGVVKTGLINLIDNPYAMRPVAAAVSEVFYRAILGQSLAVGDGNRITLADANLAGLSLMFAGAGADRNAGIDGEVSDNTLSIFVDAEPKLYRECCAVPGQQRYLNDLMTQYGYAKSALPAVVSRIDAKSGTAYSGLKKGTEPYQWGITAFTSFCDRVLAMGKIPVSRSITIVHGEADAAIVTALGQYKASLNEWVNDEFSDRLAILSARGVTQTIPQVAYIDQMGSRVKTDTQRGDLIAFDQLAISNERADVVMIGPKFHLNRKYHVDIQHLNNVGYAVMGEYQGEAEAWMHKERVAGTNVKWKPVQPVSLVKTGLQLDVTFSSPMGLPLKINTKYGTAPNLGADLENGSTTITNAVQVSDFVFRFMLAAEPAAGEYLRFGFNATDAATVPSVAGGSTMVAWQFPLVCISDTSTKVSKSDPNFVLEHFCCLSRIAIN
ncbi:hypothetical protein L365_01350 [Klebsiella pneumoniae MGH 19]|uniref:hypothetical protein n=1 Tax=Klebsiella pneumoniae TaxID=573 RepID=UPI0003BF86C2|nr:hypothetical protein [Klebsiella pneumoniae]ESN40177.1 hypothetical protein L365_01350 [Klebsiella pneumoniae MGH 19]